jgi:hypothetical protein
MTLKIVLFCKKEFNENLQKVCLHYCGYVFHEECVRIVLSFDPKCPICRKLFGETDIKLLSS